MDWNDRRVLLENQETVWHLNVVFVFLTRSRTGRTVGENQHVEAWLAWWLGPIIEVCLIKGDLAVDLAYRLLYSFALLRNYELMVC